MSEFVVDSAVSSVALVPLVSAGVSVAGAAAIGASAGYDYATTLADRSYYDCLSNAIDR